MERSRHSTTTHQHYTLIPIVDARLFFPMANQSNLLLLLLPPPPLLIFHRIHTESIHRTACPTGIGRGRGAPAQVDAASSDEPPTLSPPDVTGGRSADELLESDAVTERVPEVAACRARPVLSCAVLSCATETPPTEPAHSASTHTHVLPSKWLDRAEGRRGNYSHSGQLSADMRLPPAAFQNKTTRGMGEGFFDRREHREGKKCARFVELVFWIPRQLKLSV